MARETETARPGKTKSSRVIHEGQTKEYLAETGEACVDASSEDSFPASDPPAFTPISHTGRPKRKATKPVSH